MLLGQTLMAWVACGRGVGAVWVTGDDALRRECVMCAMCF